jgi:hypothetical protein
MRTSVALIIIIIIFNNLTTAQGIVTNNIFKNRQFVGVQSNPYYTVHKSTCQIITLRYGIEAYKNIYVGPEVSGFFYKDKEGNTGSEYNAGIYAKFIFFSSMKIKLLLEPGISYKYGKYQIYHFENPDFSKKKKDWYGSAGIMVNLYKEIVTLDLMVKYSPDYLFLRSRTIVPSYKLNFHF